MSDPIKPFACTHYWSTNHYHHDNIQTMTEFIEDRLPAGFELIEQDGSLATVKDAEGTAYQLSASGDGDSFNHKVVVTEVIQGL